MLTLEEREKILLALREWTEFTPDEPVLGFIQSNVLKTPKELFKEIEENTPDGIALMQIIEHGVRLIGIEAVVRRLSARPKAIEDI